jgi:hypothetical protein
LGKGCGANERATAKKRVFRPDSKTASISLLGLPFLSASAVAEGTYYRILYQRRWRNLRRLRAQIPANKTLNAMMFHSDRAGVGKVAPGDAAAAVAKVPGEPLGLCPSLVPIPKVWQTADNTVAQAAPPMSWLKLNTPAVPIVMMCIGSFTAFGGCGPTS